MRIVYQQRNVPTSTSVKLNCNSRWLASFRQWTTPLNRQRSSTFRQKNLSTFPRKCRTGELSRPTVTPLLEIRISGSTCKEIAKRFLKMPQTLLQRYTTNLIQKLQVFLFFPLGQQCTRFNVVNLLKSFIPGLRSQGGSAGEASPADTPRCQRSVIHQSRTAHRPPKKCLLFGCRIKAIAESLFHIPCNCFSHSNAIFVNIQQINILFAQRSRSYPSPRLSYRVGSLRESR